MSTKTESVFCNNFYLDFYKQFLLNFQGTLLVKIIFFHMINLYLNNQLYKTEFLNLLIKFLLLNFQKKTPKLF